MAPNATNLNRLSGTLPFNFKLNYLIYSKPLLISIGYLIRPKLMTLILKHMVVGFFELFDGWFIKLVHFKEKMLSEPFA